MERALRSHHQGFSLIEVVVSLLLMSVVSLLLLKQQWRSHQLLHQIQARVVGLIQADNAYEHALLHKQKGMGLPEFLVAMALSGFILALLIRQDVQMTQQHQQVQTQLEQEVDFLLIADMLRHSIQQAGFTPCLAIHHLKTYDQRNAAHPLTALHLTEKDNIQINRMSDAFDTLLQQVDSTTLLVTRTHALHKGQLVLIADCSHAEVQTVMRVMRTASGQQITFTTPLAFVYHNPAYLGEWLEKVYRVSKNKSGQKRLYYQDNHAEALSAVVLGFSSKWLGPMVRVTLVLVQGEPLVLDVLPRTR